MRLGSLQGTGGLATRRELEQAARDKGEEGGRQGGGTYVIVELGEPGVPIRPVVAQLGLCEFLLLLHLELPCLVRRRGGRPCRCHHHCRGCVRRKVWT